MKKWILSLCVTFLFGVTAHAWDFFGSDYGRELEVHFFTKPASEKNSTYATAKAYMSDTELAITLTEGEEWILGLGYYPLPLYVRCFNSDGVFVGQMKATEKFIPKWAYDYTDPEWVESDTVIFDGEKTVTYAIHPDVIDEIAIVEFSFSEQDDISNGDGRSCSKEGIEELMTKQDTFLRIINPTLIGYAELSPEDEEYILRIDDKNSLRRLSKELRPGGGGIVFVSSSDKLEENGKDIVFHLINGESLAYKTGMYSESKESGIFYSSNDGSMEEKRSNSGGNILNLFKK